MLCCLRDNPTEGGRARESQYGGHGRILDWHLVLRIAGVLHPRFAQEQVFLRTGYLGKEAPPQFVAAPSVIATS